MRRVEKSAGAYPFHWQPAVDVQPACRFRSSRSVGRTEVRRVLDSPRALCRSPPVLRARICDLLPGRCCGTTGKKQTVLISEIYLFNHRGKLISLDN